MPTCSRVVLALLPGRRPLIRLKHGILQSSFTSMTETSEATGLYMFVSMCIPYYFVAFNSQPLHPWYPCLQHIFIGHTQRGPIEFLRPGSMDFWRFFQLHFHCHRMADGIWPHLNPSHDIFAAQAAPFAAPPANGNDDSNYAAHVVQTHICPRFHRSNSYQHSSQICTRLWQRSSCSILLNNAGCLRILRKTSRNKHNWSKRSHRMHLVPPCLFLLLFCSWKILLQKSDQMFPGNVNDSRGSKGVWLLRHLHRGCFCRFFLCWCAGLQVAHRGQKWYLQTNTKKIHRGRGAFGVATMS